MLVGLAVHYFSYAALHPEKDETTPILTSKKGTSGLCVRNWVGFIEFRDPPPQKKPTFAFEVGKTSYRFWGRPQVWATPNWPKLTAHGASRQLEEVLWHLDEPIMLSFCRPWDFLADILIINHEGIPVLFLALPCIYLSCLKTTLFKRVRWVVLMFDRWTFGGFLKWGYPKIDGLFHGKKHL